MPNGRSGKGAAGTLTTARRPELAENIRLVLHLKTNAEHESSSNTLALGDLHLYLLPQELV
jgi:hypothetical protein